jgi:hypothetical protein
MTFWVAGAAVVGGVGGALIGSSASKSAANTQAAAADRASLQQREMFDISNAQQAPYRDAGGLYLNKLMHLLGQSPTVDSSSDPNFGRLSQRFDMGKFQQDPGYSFRQQEGERGMQRAAAAGGMLGSGRYLKDAMKYNSGLASQEYGQAYDRYNNDNDKQFNRYASLAGIGQTAANNLSSGASNFGNSMAQNTLAGGAARAAGTVGAANAYTGAISQGMSTYQNQQMMNRLYPQQQTAAPALEYSGLGGGSDNYNFGGGY